MTKRIDGLRSIYLNIHAYKYVIITKKKRPGIEGGMEGVGLRKGNGEMM